MRWGDFIAFRIIGNQRERGIDWAAARFSFPRYEGDWDRASALILERDGEIVASVLFHNWYPGNSVEISVAAVDGKNWLNRAFLFAVFRNPFLEWNMRRVTSRIASDNAKSIRFIEHLGFRCEGVIREGSAEGVDTLLYGMLRAECRFLGPPYNEQAERAKSA